MGPNSQEIAGLLTFTEEILNGFLKDSVLIRFCPYTRKYGSVKTRIIAYFTLCLVSIIA